MVEPITTQGAEADLFIIESVEDKQKYVLKLYRRGLKPKTDVIDILRACSRDHVIEIVNWGESDGLWFEILEYAKHGTLRDMFRKGPVKDVQMLISQLAKTQVMGIHEVDDAVRCFKVGATENPWRKEYLKEKIRKAREQMDARVKGQHQASMKTIDILMRSVMGLTGAHTKSGSSRPRGVLFFAGPTGVGELRASVFT